MRRLIISLALRRAARVVHDKQTGVFSLWPVWILMQGDAEEKCSSQKKGTLVREERCSLLGERRSLLEERRSLQEETLPSEREEMRSLQEERCSPQEDIERVPSGGEMLVWNERREEFCTSHMAVLSIFRT